MSPEMFRKKSVERLSSPEQLDSLMQVTSIPGWTVLSGLGLILLASICWILFGTIPIKVEGIGIIMHPSGLFRIMTNNDGVVRELYVREGDKVEKGQLVAYLERHLLAGEIVRKENLLKELSREYRKLAAIHLEESKHATPVPEAENRNDAEREIYILHEAGGRSNRYMNELYLKITGLRGDLRALRGEYEETTQIRSPYNGVVLEIDVDPGQVVPKGASLIRIEIVDEGDELKALLYFPSAAGKKIAKGMKAQVNPEVVHHEEYGYIQSVIEEVSIFPLSHEALMRMIQNKTFADMVIEKIGPPIGVSALLIRDPDAFSGFKWSSRQGPPIKIRSGVICRALVVVAEKRPVEFIMPLFKTELAKD